MPVQPFTNTHICWIGIALLLCGVIGASAQSPLPAGLPPPPPFAQQAPSAANGCGRTAPTFLRPVASTHVVAPFPSSALQNQESGRVMLRVVVGAQGSVTEATVLRSSGYADLDEAAISSVKDNWRWQPPPNDCAEMGVVLNVFYNWINPGAR